MNKYFVSVCMFSLTLTINAEAATDWSKRLKPTTDGVTKDEEVWSTFDINCEGPFVQIKTKKFKAKKNQNAKVEHLPQKDCLQGVFQSSIYFKRGLEDPISYKTIDGKPYLEIYLTTPGKYVQKNVPPKKYAIKLIIHDFMGKGKYPIYHQNETFKPRLDMDKPIIKYKNLIPMINYSKGRHIPVIMGNFAVFRDAELIELTTKEIASGQYLDDKYREKNVYYTYTSGDRVYGRYSAGDLRKIIPSIKGSGEVDIFNIDSRGKKLGEIEIEDIDKNGIITGRFKMRMLRESCNDILMVADCQISSIISKGQFEAKEYKSNKKLIKEGLAKPKLKLKKKLKMPGLNTGTVKPSSSEIIRDVPKPRLHKPLLGSQCKGTVGRACKAAEATFQSYSSCLSKYNFKKNDAQDTARKNLQKCTLLYNEYANQSEQCRKLFVEDKSCKN